MGTGNHGEGDGKMLLPTDYLSPALLRCSHYDGYAADRNAPYSVRTVNDYEVEY